MTKALDKKRTRAAARQGYHCYYCGLPMWDVEPARFASRYGLTLAQARMLQCTAEHLHPRSEGGRDGDGNIVAACRYCNSHRHMAHRALDPSAYRTYVVIRMKRGDWVAGLLPRAFTRRASVVEVAVCLTSAST